MTFLTTEPEVPDGEKGFPTMDFGLLPPEINSTRMFAGTGSAPLSAAAAAWDWLADELHDTAVSYSSAISGVTGNSRSGPASKAMAAGAAPYVTWIKATAAQAEQSASQARAAAAAYETAGGNSRGHNAPAGGAPASVGSPSSAIGTFGLPGAGPTLSTGKALPFGLSSLGGATSPAVLGSSTPMPLANISQALMTGAAGQGVPALVEALLNWLGSGPDGLGSAGSAGLSAAAPVGALPVPETCTAVPMPGPAGDCLPCAAAPGLCPDRPATIPHPAATSR